MIDPWWTKYAEIRSVLIAKINDILAIFRKLSRWILRANIIPTIAAPKEPDAPTHPAMDADNEVWSSSIPTIEGSTKNGEREIEPIKEKEINFLKWL